MEVVLLQSAQADLLEIYSQRGEASYHVIDRSLERIRLMPEIAPVYHGHFHRKLVRGTPFGIFYAIAGTRIIVSFILDLRQDPSVIERRLSSGR
jgi:plasmid stabilization system protein ParE